jgi:hypothetical protein
MLYQVITDERGTRVIDAISRRPVPAGEEAMVLAATATIAERTSESAEQEI